MCSTRNSQYYEKVSDPLDLSTIEKQILTGHYKTVEAFDTDMLKVFRNAEVSMCASRRRKGLRRVAAGESNSGPWAYSGPQCHYILPARQYTSTTGTGPPL